MNPRVPLRNTNIVLVGVMIAIIGPAFPPQSFAEPRYQRDVSRNLYDRVMQEFQRKDYEAALAGFQFFLELHGQSALAANAHYWTGECQFRLRRYEDALTSFYNVVSYHPLSSKVPASTLKIGQAHVKLGDYEKAKMMFERVIDQFPDSPEAETARKHLDTVLVRSDVLPEPTIP